MYLEIRTMSPTHNNKLDKCTSSSFKVETDIVTVGNNKPTITSSTSTSTFTFTFTSISTSWPFVVYFYFGLYELYIIIKNYLIVIGHDNNNDK